MPRHLQVAVPLLASLLVAAPLGGCGGDGEAPAPPPVVSCGATANSGTLGVGDQATCGTVSGLGSNGYTFTSGAAGTYTVTLSTTSGDADLYVYAGGSLVGSSIAIPPTWVDRVVFQAAASTTYTVVVQDANYNLTGSTYGVQVSSP